MKLRSRNYNLPGQYLAEGEKWKPQPIFNGKTGKLQGLSCHVSVIAHGHSPHPPHEHEEEELLIVLKGEADLLLNEDGAVSRKRLRENQFVYYPAHFAHTIQAASEEPAEYLMFKWQGSFFQEKNPLNFGQFDALVPQDAPEGPKGFSQQMIFEGATAYLEKLHCHATVLGPQAGYPPHADPYDVAILMLDGNVQTLGEQVKAPAVAFYEAGTLHGMHNPAGVTARYLVFEFWGRKYENILFRAINKFI